MKKFFLVLMSIALLATACSEDGATTEQPGNGKDKLYSINGAIQKGPFVQGSNILIQTLNEKLNPIGQSYTTSTINNAGMFEMADVNSKYIEVIATGYYFDEVTGELSSGPLTLRSINELTDGVTTNVNILTSLTYNRIKNLVSKQGLSIVDANHQAEQELYDALKIPENMRPNVRCDKMDIANSGDGNGFLLAVSAVLQRGRTVAELTEYISKFSADLADDGIVGDETIEKFNSNALPTMDFENTIKDNIKKRYDSLGVDYTIPDFEKYISSLPQGKQYCIIPFTYKDEYDDVNMGQFDFKTDVKFLGKSYKDGKGEIYLSASPTIVYGPVYPFISSIVIPDSVTEIGEGAFACNYLLTDITLGNSLAIIGKEAFASCTSLASITIPASVTEIGEYAFLDVFISKENFINNSSLDAEAANYWGAQLFDAVTEDGLCINGTTIITCKNSATNVTIPDSVTAIGDGAFCNCWGLTTITIPNSVTTIGGGAFRYCRLLTSITIPDSVTSIGDSAFSGCEFLTSVTIPDSVTSISDGVFSDCWGLTTITIPDSVTSIGDSAFYNCHSLTSITIPGSVTTIGRDAFSGCTSLTSITIPDSVTSIGGGAFYRCESLTSVTIPDSVTSIGSSAFYDCRSLKSVYVNITDLAAYSTNNVMNRIEVDKHLLVNGVEITELLVPDSVTTIGRGAFSGCTSLTSITIPDSVTSIGGSAFYNCTSLKEVYCQAKTPPTGGGWYMFDNNASGRKIYVPRNSVAAYKSSRYWSSYANDIVGYDF